MSSSYSSTSYTSSSTSSSTNGQQVQATQTQQTSYTDTSGNTVVQTASQNLGEPVVQETRQYDSEGRELVGDTGAARVGGSGATARIQDVTDEEQRANDKLYEERMEEEYAKREGGA